MVWLSDAVAVVGTRSTGQTAWFAGSALEHILAPAKRVESELGQIDVWVNVAMTSVFAPVKEMTPAEFRRVTEVSYLGYVNLGKSGWKSQQTSEPEDPQ
ncbi:MAG TPA: hypothetical protein VE860_13260 [Chthoniobacterales bacterium]|jgi:NAD(P)-dependent dehydrogenase (short-subunit alcohol dehydrogenase family)|nr:hypothetical protein [Chthoniobacterales bacterium]